MEEKLSKLIVEHHIGISEAVPSGLCLFFLSFEIHPSIPAFDPAAVGREQGEGLVLNKIQCSFS